MLQFKHRTTLQCLLFLFRKSRSRIVFRKVWSLLLWFLQGIFEGSQIVSFISQPANYKLGFTLSGGRTHQSSPSTPGFPLQTPDLYEVAPSSTLLPNPLPSPFAEVFKVAPIQTLLPIPLPTPFTHVYTSPEPPDPEGKTSLFDQVSSVLILV